MLRTIRLQESNLPGSELAVDRPIIARTETLHEVGIEQYVMVYRDFGEQDLRDQRRMDLQHWNNGHIWRAWATCSETMPVPRSASDCSTLISSCSPDSPWTFASTICGGVVRLTAADSAEGQQAVEPVDADAHSLRRLADNLSPHGPLSLHQQLADEHSRVGPCAEWVKLQRDCIRSPVRS
ncbi:MAG: hypothetical protein JOZ87_04140 [Chloroflexi bacterium]|nr:hypothetical protein [Chloroflexota bacterium]